MSKAKAGWRLTLLQAVCLLLGSSLLGLAVNQRLVLDAFAGRVTTIVAAPDEMLTAFPAPVLLEDIDALVMQGALVVDARPGEIYNLGHIAGAISLPLLVLDEALPSFQKKVSRERPVITYCSGYGCEDSFDVAMHLILEGYRSVYIYEGGFPEWQAAGRPVAGGKP